MYIGNSQEELLIKCNKKIYLLFRDKWIDVLDVNGNLNVRIKNMISSGTPTSSSSDGFYCDGTNVYIKIGSNIINMTELLLPEGSIILYKGKLAPYGWYKYADSNKFKDAIYIINKDGSSPSIKDVILKWNPSTNPFKIMLGEQFTSPVLEKTVNGNIPLVISYSSSNPNKATIDSNGNVTIKDAGLTIITAKTAANSQHGEASASYVLIINEKPTPVEPDTPIEPDIPDTPTIPDGATDLGLAGVWANCNVGATVETGYGTYFTYLEALGQVTSGWRLPTADDFHTLWVESNYEWTTINGVYGEKFTNKLDSSKYVFFPASGYINITAGFTSPEGIGNQGRYWTSTNGPTSGKNKTLQFNSVSTPDNILAAELPVGDKLTIRLISDGTVPSGGGTTPSSGGTTPGGGDTPSGGGTTPGGDTPSGGGTTPSGGGTTPSGGGDTPSGGGTTPTTGSSYATYTGGNGIKFVLMNNTGSEARFSGGVVLNLSRNPNDWANSTQAYSHMHAPTVGTSFAYNDIIISAGGSYTSPEITTITGIYQPSTNFTDGSWYFMNSDNSEYVHSIYLYTRIYSKSRNETSGSNHMYVATPLLNTKLQRGYTYYLNLYWKNPDASLGPDTSGNKYVILEYGKTGL